MSFAAETPRDERRDQDAAAKAVGPVSSPREKIAVACRGLSKTYPGATTPVLHEVSLTIASNAFFTLLGPSGCGKTTLLRLIAGLETADAGSILVEGQALDGLPPYRRPVNTVFQSYAVFPHLSVFQNVAFGLEMQGRPRAFVKARVHELLALVRLEGLSGRRPAQLSGGQLQRVALARALAASPKVLLLDEPLSALDYKLRSEMQLELKRLQHETGITFVFVTHDQDEALAMSDRIAVMQAGRIVQIGSPEEIYEAPANRFVAGFVGEMTFLDVTPGPDGTIRLASGQAFALEGLGPLRTAGVLAIRPEHARITDPESGLLAGMIEEIVYTGNDRKYQVMLPGVGRLAVREPSGSAPGRRRGDRVGISFRGDAVRIMAP